MNRRIGLLALLLVPGIALATDHFILIGGGPQPKASEAQIEFNVNWVVASLRELVPKAKLTVHFANGTDAARTAVEFVTHHQEPDPELQALATVYGDAHANRLRFRAHRVADVVGSTHRDTLVPALRRYLEALRPGDQAMIIYNGHGSLERDPASNALRLWDESRLDVREFERLLGGVDPSVPVRFVLTQCYSGAFARAAYANAEASLVLARGHRCGFFAESDDRQSEGCSASVNLGDYRDYTTFFFAGLTGKDRLGQPVPGATDHDHDGRISPFDAHLYSLVEGYNGDLPRSTSEDWLERWQPWESRWVGTGRLPDNVYGTLAREMAARAGLPEDGGALGEALAKAYDSLVRENDEALRAGDALEKDATRTREGVRVRLERRWAELAHPYTAAYRDLVVREGADVERAIRSDSAFAELQRQQLAIEAFEPRLVDLDRRISALDKLRRTRMLARALDQLQRHGSRSHRDAYGRLRACEALPLRGN